MAQQRKRPVMVRNRPSAFQRAPRAVGTHSRLPDLVALSGLILDASAIGDVSAFDSEGGDHGDSESPANAGY